MVYEGSEYVLNTFVRILLARTNSSSRPAYQDSFSCIKARPNKSFVFRELSEINSNQVQCFVMRKFWVSVKKRFQTKCIHSKTLNSKAKIYHHNTNSN